ncbi:uncharacterized protein AAEQ78_024870 [Lycaon pictus]
MRARCAACPQAPGFRGLSLRRYMACFLRANSLNREGPNRENVPRRVPRTNAGSQKRSLSGLKQALPPLRTARCPPSRLPALRPCGVLGLCRCAQRVCHPPRPKRGPPETCCNLKPMHLLASLKGILRLKANEETGSQSISVASVPRPKNKGRPRRAELREEADKESPSSQPLIQGCFLQIWPQNEVSKGFKNAS